MAKLPGRASPRVRPCRLARAGVDDNLPTGDDRRGHLEGFGHLVPGLEAGIVVVEVMTLAVCEGDADQILDRTLCGLGGDPHPGQRGVEHDPSSDEVLPRRQLVLATASLAF